MLSEATKRVGISYSSNGKLIHSGPGQCFHTARHAHALHRPPQRLHVGPGVVEAGSEPRPDCLWVLGSLWGLLCAQNGPCLRLDEGHSEKFARLLLTPQPSLPAPAFCPGHPQPLGLYPCWSLHLECLAGHTRLLFALGSPSPWPGLSTATNPFLFLKK